MNELIIALMIGNGSITANCQIDHSDKKIVRQNIDKESKYSYFNNGYKITEKISLKGDSWITIEKENKSMTYAIKCEFSHKNVVN